MQDSIKALVEVIRTAIQSESDGYHFYKMAGQNTEDTKAREVFNMLAEEEHHHADFLRQQYRSISETGKPDGSIRLRSPGAFSDTSPIFSGSLKSRIVQAHMEMSALSIGMQLELDSEKFYREQVRANSDVAVTTFFTELAEWEAGHYRALKQQMDELKEEYWNSGGFAPF